MRRGSERDVDVATLERLNVDVDLVIERSGQNHEGAGDGQLLADLGDVGIEGVAPTVPPRPEGSSDLTTGSLGGGAGLIRAEVERFSLDGAPEAYRRMAAGELDGRAVIVPDD